MNAIVSVDFNSSIISVTYKTKTIHNNKHWLKESFQKQFFQSTHKHQSLSCRTSDRYLFWINTKIDKRNLLGQPRNTDEGGKRHQHSHRPEGKHLTGVLIVVVRIMDERIQPQLRFATGDADQERHDVRWERPVRVAVMLEVNDHQELREQDAVNEIGAHGPETVDRRDGQSHHSGQDSGDEDGGTHYPDDLHLGGLWTWKTSFILLNWHEIWAYDNRTHVSRFHNYKINFARVLNLQNQKCLLIKKAFSY